MSSNLEWIETGNQEVEEEAFTDKLLKHFRSIYNHKWIILSITLAAFFYSTYSANQKADYFSATSRIVIHELQKQNSQFKEEVTADSRGRDYFATQVQIMESYDVLVRAARELKLVEQAGLPTEDVAVTVLRRSISASAVRGTRVIDIRATYSDPKMAALMANAVATSFIRQNLEDNLFLNEQILKWFPDSANQSEKSSPLEMLKKLDDDSAMMSLPSVTNDPIIKETKRKLIDLNAKRDELLSKYTEGHPVVKENNTQIKYLESELIIQARKITSAMKTSLSGQFNVSNIKILEHAKPIRKPAGPNRKKQILKQTLIGLALGILLAVLLDSMDKSVKTDEDLQSISELPILGQVPMRLTKAKSSATPESQQFTELKDDPVIEDAFTALRTALIFSMPQGLNKRIMVTSSIPGEGKSTVSHLLAYSFAKIGEKVLYIELDLRRPSLKKYLPETNAHKAGMSELLVGQAKLEEVTVQSPLHANLKVIPAGSKSPNPTILFNSPNFDELFETVEKMYDRIIVDTPPAFSIPDSIQISQKIHGLVFVVGCGQVHKKIVEKTLNKFRFVQSIIFGTILNQVTLKTSSYYDKYRYENYGRDSKD